MILRDQLYDVLNVHVDVCTFNRYGAFNDCSDVETGDDYVSDAFSMIRSSENSSDCEEYEYCFSNTIDSSEILTENRTVSLNCSYSCDDETSVCNAASTIECNSNNNSSMPHSTENSNSKVSEPLENPNEDLLKFAKIHAKNLVFSHLNINSLSSKFMEIHQILHKGFSDILFLSETKLDDSYPNAQFHVNQFLIHRLDRNAHGGGLICYVKESIPHRNRPDIAVNKDGIESIVIQIKTSKKNMFFLHVYKPPNIHVNHLSNALDRQSM